MPPATTPPGISKGKDDAGGSLPTVDDPFNFPSNAELPAYSPAGSSAGQLPIAIPQASADAASPFVSAYPPSLLGRGVTVQAWHSFLSTTSAFLTAKVSDRALSHAADMAKHIGDGPTRMGKGIAAHAKHVGKHIASNAKRGNIIGAAFGVVGGAVSIPVVSALSAAGTASALPASVVGAVFKKPQTPQQRAEAYAAVANKKWLNDRGLHAQLLTTVQLSQMLGLPENALLGMAQQAKSPSAAYQLRVLASHIAPLDVDETAQLQLATSTLWLVLTM
jgi:hypothetical protein